MWIFEKAYFQVFSSVSLTSRIAQDNNTGLVIQVLDASRKFSVLRLERTFAALSIPEVVARARLQDKTVEETEAFVNSLISSGELKGTLLQSADPSKPTILRFTSATSDAFSEAEIRDELAAQKQRLNKLLGHIQASDHKLELGREYIDNLRRDRKRKIAAGKNGSGAATAATAGVGNGADYVFEEDMMGDVKWFEFLPAFAFRLEYISLAVRKRVILRALKKKVRNGDHRRKGVFGILGEREKAIFIRRTNFWSSR